MVDDLMGGVFIAGYCFCLIRWVGELLAALFFCVLIGSVGSHLLRNICFLFVCLEMVGGELFVASFVLIRCVGGVTSCVSSFFLLCFALL
jgi:hypothetical protein